MPIRFLFSELEREIEALRQIARDYIDNKTSYTLKNLLDELGNIAYSDPTVYSWGIPTAKPLCTVPSKAYDGKCTHEVVAKISAIWQVRPVREGRGSKKPARFLEIAGKASTRISLIDKTEDKELARWRMEIASDGGPGCYFHVQIMGEETDEKFPHSLPVPRLPSIITTPMTAVEFVLAELFQESNENLDPWIQHCATSSESMNMWSSIQQRRLEKLLKWHLQLISQRGSPLANMKKAQPDLKDLLFC